MDHLRAARAHEAVAFLQSGRRADLRPLPVPLGGQRVGLLLQVGEHHVRHFFAVAPDVRSFGGCGGDRAANGIAATCCRKVLRSLILFTPWPAVRNTGPEVTAASCGRSHDNDSAIFGPVRLRQKLRRRPKSISRVAIPPTNALVWLLMTPTEPGALIFAAGGEKLGWFSAFAMSHVEPQP